MTNRKNYLMTFLSGFGGAVITTALGLITAPLSLSYWKEERYGLWAILLSVLAYLNVSNFGIGQAATTLIGKNNDFRDKRRILARSALALGAAILIACAALIILNAVYPAWPRLLGRIPGRLEEEAKTTCILIAAFFFLNLPFTLVTSLLNGTQRAYLENVFQISGTAGNFVGLLVVIGFRLPLPMLAVANGGISFLLNAVKATIAFRGFKKGRAAGEGAGSWAPARDTGYKTLLRTSLRFFLVWLAATLVWNTDNFVVSNVIGLKEVTPYSLTFKFYNLIFTCLFIVNNSLLPLMAREFGAGNWEWISRNYRRFVILGTSLGGLALVGGLSFGRDFVLLWTGGRGYAGLGVLLFLGLYSYLLAMVNFNSGIINAFNYTKGTWAIAFAEGGAKIMASILLGRSFGMAGVAAGTMIGSLAAPAWLCPLLIRKRSGARLAFPLKSTLIHFALCIVPAAAILLLIQAKAVSPWARLVPGACVTAAYCLASWLTWPPDLRRDAAASTKSVIGKLWKR